jgi:hypothetical protein
LRVRWDPQPDAGGAERRVREAWAVVSQPYTPAK